MLETTQNTSERAEVETTETANRLIPYWPDGHWETSLDTADVMDRIEAYGPVPHRTLEVAYGASNEAISEAVKRRASQWDYDPAYQITDDPIHAGFDPVLTDANDPVPPCAQGHTGSVG